MIEDFCKLNKTLSDATCLEEPPGGFCDVGYCCCFVSLEVFHSLLFGVILHTSVNYRRVFTPILCFQPSSSQSDSWHFHFNSATVLSRRFLPTGVFYLALLPHILVRFCESDAGGNTRCRILLSTCPQRFVPSSWRMVLNYSYFRYKTIGLSIAPVSHEVQSQI